ncbi:MAG: tail fiber domain-containing protein [Pyrinomonadaceae bacterium]
MFKNLVCRFSLAILFIQIVVSINAQTTRFNYQGSLNDNGSPANGSYDLEFRLFDAASGGNQLGPFFSFSGYQVSNGLISMPLDFGNQFSGQLVWLEIRVRATGSGSFNTLDPRTLISSAPYSVKSLVTENANTATNALQLGGVVASQFVVTTDPRLSDARTPLPNNGSYIQNGTSLQSSSNFNVSGTGTAGTINATSQFNLASQRILSAPSNGNLFLGFGSGVNIAAGTENTFLGTSSGISNGAGSGNTFAGNQSGFANTTGSQNSYFGRFSGQSNTLGNSNSFFGWNSGRANTTATDNSFFGAVAGLATQSGGFNSFFGTGAGVANTSGASNSFFGISAGAANVSGSNNTILGATANLGSGNLSFATAIGAGAVATSSNQIMLGRSGGQETVTVPGSLLVGTLGTAGSTSVCRNGSNALSTCSATFVADSDPRLSDARNPLPGSSNYINNSSTTQTADFNINGTGTASIINAETQFKLRGERIISDEGLANLFVGFEAGLSMNFGTGTQNAFFGRGAGRNNIGGGNNSFFGAFAGNSNDFGSDNSFFGTGSGVFVTNGLGNSFYGSFSGHDSTASHNSFFGMDSGRFNSEGDRNSFFGSRSGRGNITGSENAFFGYQSALANTTGAGNAFFGRDSGNANTTGSRNTFIGWFAGDANTTGSDNTTLGASADVGGSNLSFATAIGAGSQVTTSNTIALGRTNGTDKVRVFGLGAAGSTALCRNTSNEISTCSSSIRYKSNVNNFRSGLNLIRRLRPVSFNWTDGGMLDVGLVAEEVAETEPLLVTTNTQGEVEGVKYDRVGVVLVNAVNEQQTQIESLQEVVREQKETIDKLRAELESLMKLICAQNPNSEPCKQQQ